MSLWDEARRCLAGERRAAAVLGAVLYSAEAVCLAGGFIARRMLVSAGILRAGGMERGFSLWDLVLLGSWLAFTAVLAPVRVQAARQLGQISGLLCREEEDILCRCGNLCLWGKAAAVWVAYGFYMLAAGVLWVIPALCAGLLWAFPRAGEDIWQIFGAAHLFLLSAVLVVLPLRVLAAGTALPYCFLKMPYAGAHGVISAAFRATSGKMFSILGMRAGHLPALLLPLPSRSVLLTAEQLRAARHIRTNSPTKKRKSYAIFRNFGRKLAFRL